MGVRPGDLAPGPVCRRWAVMGKLPEIASKGGKYRHSEFIEFVLDQYVHEGVQELDEEKLTPSLRLRYNNAIADAVRELGPSELIRRLFTGFQDDLYNG
ncbi:type I restriction-modification enzyme R subunit C-terminal domain-containing protein [Arenimonas sp.]|uniref:type I restriction-modification enzyme R subunit C-terminal domain-containing protein n=1 Tax=Arenimonas sp. TaxID=1872635 RepID=UPI0035B12239